MLYPKCPTCKRLLAHIQIPYEELIDSGKTQNEALKLLNIDSLCCRMRVLTYVRLIDYIR